MMSPLKRMAIQWALRSPNPVTTPPRLTFARSLSRTVVAREGESKTAPVPERNEANLEEGGKATSSAFTSDGTDQQGEAEHLRGGTSAATEDDKREPLSFDKLFSSFEAKSEASDKTFSSDESDRELSPFDQVFGSRNSEAKSHDRSALPRSVLGEENRELNREWEGSIFGRAASGTPRLRRGERPGAAASRSELTQSEARDFERIFDEIYRSDRPSSGKKVDDYSSEGAFGASVGIGNRDDESLEAFADRAVRSHRDKARKESKRSQFGIQRPRTRAIAALKEGNAFDNVNYQQLEEDVENARSALAMCETESHVWAWAGKEVFGSDAEHKPTYGIDTPCYAPVLHEMLKVLRQRFKAPHSALAVLRITRALGPASVVMGCTPHLYAEALRTRFRSLGDLQGAYEVLREARETGVLGGSSQAGAFTAHFAVQKGDSDSLRDERLIRQVVTDVQADVRRRAVEVRYYMGKDEDDLLSVKQDLRLLDQMDRQLGPARTASSR